MNNMSETAARKKKYLFSTPYIYSKSQLAVKKNSSISKITDIKGKKVAETTTSNNATDAKRLGATITPTDSFQQSIDLVSQGRVAGTINSRESFYAYFKQNPKANIKLIDSGDHIASQKIGAIVTKQHPKMQKQISKAIQELRKDGTLKNCPISILVVTLLIRNVPLPAIMAGYIAPNSNLLQEAPYGFNLAHHCHINAANCCSGFKYTIPIAIISFILGLILAIFTALVKISTRRGWFLILKAIANFYVWLFRSTPLLVQLFIVYFGLPYLKIKGLFPNGVQLDPWTAGIATFSLNTGAYCAETIRAAILSIPQGQWEAAYSIGMTKSQVLKRIILPQAARVSLPPLSNSFISLVKDTPWPLQSRLLKCSKSANKLLLKIINHL
ncbi:cystine ABC transporter permease [Lactiplantibacillus plantarum]|nr:cystine ABC transporter permease [Lactiplantibacillus plantarum]